MQSTLGFDQKQRYIDLIVRFRKYMGMQIGEPTYDRAATFIAGMDYIEDGQILKNFKLWLYTRIKKRSAFAWPSHIPYSIDGFENLSEHEKIDVLLDLILEFLSES